MHSSDIVGYTFAADQFCPGCIVDMLPTGEGERFDGWDLAEGVSMSVEDNLREIAAAFSIDYDDLSSYDSEEFPKPIFADQVENSDDYCGHCTEPLIESDDNHDDEED